MAGCCCCCCGGRIYQGFPILIRASPWWHQCEGSMDGWMDGYPSPFLFLSFVLPVPSPRLYVCTYVPYLRIASTTAKPHVALKRRRS